MENIYSKMYETNKRCYMNLYQNNQNVQIGGYSKKFQDNIFLNMEHFGMHHSLKYRQRRIHDINQLINALKNHLVPKSKIDIDKNLLKKYIQLHKKKNRHLIDSIMSNLQYVTFHEFEKQVNIQINRFNSYLTANKIKKYVFVFGVGSDAGATSSNFNLFKSNFWVFLLAYKHLKVKPYDVILNLNVAIRLYHPTIKDFLLVDDCSYSGSQLVDSVLTNSVSELLYNNKNVYVIVDKQQVMYEPVLDKNCNVHVLIPYVSSIALKKINNFEMISSIRIIKYFSRIIKTYGDILDWSTLKNINELYKKYYSYLDFAYLTPIFFQHKIADMLSTIELILIKGQVLDNPAKKLVFIKECIYDKNDPNKYDLNPKQENFTQKKLYCPVPPYLEFSKYLS
jgi:hypothetical protein